MLTEGEFTAKDLSRLLGIREKEVYEHLPHIQRSLGPSVSIVRQQPMCLNCNFVFTKRERFTTPGRCPVCRSARITGPIFGIVQKNRDKKSPGKALVNSDQELEQNEEL